MGLISGLYYRGNPKQKPKQWGPSSLVRSVIIDRLSRILRDKSSIICALPMFECSGKYVYDYSGNQHDGLLLSPVGWSSDCVTGFTYSNGIDFTSSELINTPVNGNFTILLYAQSLSFPDATVFRAGFAFGGTDDIIFYPYDRNFEASGGGLCSRFFWRDMSIANIRPGVPHSLTDSDIHVFSVSVDVDQLSLTITADDNANSYNISSLSGVGPFDSFRIGAWKDSYQPYVGKIGGCYIFQEALSVDTIFKFVDNPYYLIQPPTLRSYFDFGSTASSISCNLLAAAAQATRIIQ